MGKKQQRAAIAVGVALFAAVFLVFFRAVELSGNSLTYAFDAQTGTLEDLFYPAHLGFSSVVRVFGFVVGQGTDCSIVCAGQVHAILWAITGVVCMYLLVERLTDSSGPSLTAAASLLVASGFWVFATQLEVYVPTVGALLLLTTILFFAADRWPEWLLVASCAAV